MESSIELPKGMKVKIAAKIEGKIHRNSNEVVTIRQRLIDPKTAVPSDFYYVEENNLAWNVSELTPI